MKMRYLTMACLAVLFAVQSGAADQEAPPSKETVMAADRVVPAGKPQVFNRVEIKVGNEIITTVDIDEPVAKYREHFSLKYRGQELEEKMDEVRKTHIERMIEGKLLLLEARDQDMEVDDAVIEEQVDKEIEKLRAQFPSYKDFKAQLEKDHLTESDLRKQRMQATRENLIRQRLLQGKLQEFKTGVEVSDDKLKAYYQEHLDDFSRPGRAKLSQIFIQRPDAGLSREDYQAQDAAAKEKIRRAANVLSQGKAFEAVARQYSEHQPTAEKGGDIGWIEQGDIGFPEFEKAVFKTLKPGEVSDILTTPKGYFIVRLADLQSGGQLPFEEVRGRIRKQMMAESSDMRYQAWIETLKEKYKIVYAGKNNS